MSPTNPIDIEPRLKIVQAQMPDQLKGRVEDLGDRLSVAVPEDFKDPEFIEKVKTLLAAMINEDTTDVIVEMIKPLAPWGLGWVLGKLLDRLLPEQLLAIAFSLLDQLT